jgi:hypothetical protein
MINRIKNLFKKKEEQFTPVFPPNSWSVCSTTGKMLFKIPVGNLSKEEAEKQLKQLISSYQTNYWFPNTGMTKAEKIEKILNKIQPKEEN